MVSQCELLVERLQKAHQRLNALIPQAPTDKCIYPNWTIKEYLDHISGWDDAAAEALRAHANNEPVPQSAARGIDVYNAQTVSTREAIDLNHTFREFEASRQAVIQALRELPAEKYSQTIVFPWGGAGSVDEFIEVFIEHDEHHADHLEAWLKNPDEVIGEH